MEVLISIIGGALAAGAVFGLKRIGGALLVAQYGSIINKVYEVIDPIAAQLISSYNDSVVRDAIELAVYRVADNELDEADALAIAHFITEHFDILKAADSKLDPNSSEGAAALEIAALVKDLTDGASKDELVALARKAIALF